MKKILTTLILTLIMLTATFLTACDASGESAYEIAVRNGFVGTEVEWLESLEGSAVERGDSAYEIAVKNGFEGTEAEWLASLKGTNGTNGKDGVDGVDGEDGQDATIESIWAKAQEEGYEGTFLEFLEEYLSLEASGNASYFGVQKGLKSSVSIHAGGSAGAGVIYKLDKNKGDAYILTNYHVTYDAISTTPQGSIEVFLYGEKYGSSTLDYGIDATYIGGSLKYDVSVLKITNCERLKTANVEGVEFANSNDVIVGQEAIAIGNPSDGGISASMGIVSVDSESIKIHSVANELVEIVMRAIRVDTTINRGNSGGGLFDTNGKLLGLVNAKSSADGIDNIGYVIPSSIVKGCADNIIDHCEGQENKSVLKCVLGITTQIVSSKTVWDEVKMTSNIVEETKVVIIGEGSKAEGKFELDDILVGATLTNESGKNLSINIKRTFELSDFLLNARVGDTLTVTVKRNNIETDIVINIVDNTFFVDADTLI